MKTSAKKMRKTGMGLPIVGPVNKTILGFVGNDYLFSGSVCVDWVNDYGSRKGTGIRNCLSSVSRVQECITSDDEFKKHYGLFNEAVIVGNLEVLQLLHSTGWSWGWNRPGSENPFPSASLNGSLENMKWLKDQECPWGYCTFAAAAKNGCLENMKWLKEQGCRWDEATFQKSVRGGCLENMEWLKDKGCPFGEDTFTAAAENGCLDNMKWLKE